MPTTMVVEIRLPVCVLADLIQIYYANNVPLETKAGVVTRALKDFAFSAKTQYGLYPITDESEAINIIAKFGLWSSRGGNRPVVQLSNITLHTKQDLDPAKARAKELADMLENSEGKDDDS